MLLLLLLLLLLSLLLLLLLLLSLAIIISINYFIDSTIIILTTMLLNTLRPTFNVSIVVVQLVQQFISSVLLFTICSGSAEVVEMLMVEQMMKKRDAE